MNLETVRKTAGREEIDYLFLMSMLERYARPREKISAWLKSGDLIRVKKGLYVFGPRIALSPFSHEVLANLIYGPSAISLEYALSLYGLIPERVTTVTSITPLRNKQFSTPVGVFTYRYISSEKFSAGIKLTLTSENCHVLIAGPEKALCDLIYLTWEKNFPLSNDSMHDRLIHDLRINDDALHSLKMDTLNRLAAAYKDPRISLLVMFLKKWRGSSHPASRKTPHA